MSKKRHYYDGKGRYKGHSSSESPQKRNLKAALFAGVALIIYGLFIDHENGDKEETKTKISATNGDKGKNTEGASAHDRQIKN